MSLLKNMNPYELHKHLVNEYILINKGSTKLLGRDTSKDKRDFDVIKDNHRFLWDDDPADTWEKQLAKKYYDKLFKEYCICDLSKYKENKNHQYTNIYVPKYKEKLFRHVRLTGNNDQSPFLLENKTMMPSCNFLRNELKCVFTLGKKGHYTEKIKGKDMTCWQRTIRFNTVTTRKDKKK